ncbi:hypothetical protein BST16_19265 [Mycobacterium asiaticum DSM 44297]|uniref:DNA polymerase n=2 Tax=Mycobacterium asiaticum TaxID=1790 RepID=UPI000569C242|nr:hypothetical protein A5661_19280 [Mycobacterium asiaticum]ORA11631.1 hypothetical protein BST16_19265 [Mycobacterium asiaticum DSM 44297]
MSLSKDFDVRGRVLEAGELPAWLSEHSLGNRFGLSVAATGTGYDARAVALAIVAADGDGRFLDLAALTQDDTEALVSWLADPGPPKAVHDATTAMHALGRRDWALRGITSDTVLAARLLCPERQSGSLNELLVHHMRCALPTEAFEGHSPQGLILQACAVLDLADVLDEELARIDSSSLLGRLELPAQRVLTELVGVGVAVDPRILAANAAPKPVAPDGRIHVAAAGHEVCEAVVAGEGYAELMVAQYRDLDTPILAHWAGEGAVIDQARRLGYASTLLGRRRYLPGLGSNDPRMRAAAERAAVAMAIRGSADDIVKVAMINVDQAIKAVGLRSRLVLQLSGRLVFEVVADERDDLAGYVRDSMCGAYPLDEPLEVSIGCGPILAAAMSHIRE